VALVATFLPSASISGLVFGEGSPVGSRSSADELQGKIFDIGDKDDASSYVVSPTESTDTGTSSAACRLLNQQLAR
jgi:hypothetical protein